MSEAGLAVVLSGPSGVGKGAVHAIVRQALPDAHLSVSVTTRPPRAGEVDGVHYRFVDTDTFDTMVAAGAFLEHATYAGNEYGTPREQVASAVDEGHIVILDIEVQGAIQVKRAIPSALLVFLVPPSMDELERRLRARGTEDEETIVRRLARAREELAQHEAFDVVVVNDDLERCVGEVIDHIIAARGG